MDEQNSQRPYDAETVRKVILKMVEHYNTHTIAPVEKGIKGVIIGVLNSIFGSDEKGMENEKRHTVLGWLFGEPGQILKPMSSKSLTEAQWWALYKWMMVGKILLPDGNSKWLPCQDFYTEALFVLHASIQKAYKDEGQLLLALGFEKDGEIK